MAHVLIGPGFTGERNRPFWDLCLYVPSRGGGMLSLIGTEGSARMFVEMDRGTVLPPPRGGGRS